MPDGDESLRIGRSAPGAIRLWLLLGLALLLLAVLQQPLREALLPQLLPTGEARWIWPGETARENEPLAVYAVRDFRLGRQPQGARLLILGDEEYLVRLNGTLVGANRYLPGAQLDHYHLDGLLREGMNRISVELRSSRGDGGLLCSLEMSGTTEERIVSDGNWRIIKRHLPGLLEGGELPILTYPVEVLGLPPTGRWGRLSVGQAREPLQARLEELAPREPKRVLFGESRAVLSRAGKGVGGRPDASWITFDWGREVTGYLVIGFRRSRIPPALLFVGAEPPSPRTEEPTASIIGVPGQSRWLDSRPRTFRYATIVATAPVERAVLHPIELQGQAPPTVGGEMAGVFGLRAPSLRTPVEHEVWREVERLSSFAVGEDL